MDPILNLTAKELAALRYSTALQCAKIVDSLRAKTNRTDEENLILDRNIEHLKLIVTKDFWTTEDLGPLKHAIA